MFHFFSSVALLYLLDVIGPDPVYTESYKSHSWLKIFSYFGIIKRFDEYSKKHLVRSFLSFSYYDYYFIFENIKMISKSSAFMWSQVMFEDGDVEFLDLSKEDWELITL